MSALSKASTLDLILILALAAVILLKLSAPVDEYLSAELCRQLGLSDKASQNTHLALFLNAFLAAVYSAGGFICARFLRSATRLIVMLQLLVLTVIVIFPFYKAVLLYVEPISYLACGVLGYVFGINSYKLHQASERLNTQQAESALRSRQLLETRLQLIKQDEIERKMLAADLHDQVLNDLKLLLRMLEQHKEKLGAALMSDFNKRIELAMENIRKVMESLCPSDLEHIGLLASLEECLKDKAEKNDFLPQFRSSLKEDDLSSLNKIEKALLYRLVQESITNICKHARASKVRLLAEIQDSELAIKVQDDGGGIKDGPGSKSRGLQYMKLRAEIIGARINWSPGPDDKGTVVDIKMNLAGRGGVENTDS